MRACTISWKNQCSRNFGKFIKQSDPIIQSEYAETTHPKNQAENDAAETTHGRKPMFNECATSAFQRQGSDRYRSLVIATTSCNRTHSASLILNIAISEPLLKHKQKVWSQIWSDKEFKIDQT